MSKPDEVSEKILNGIVSGYRKIEDKFTGAFLKEDGSLRTGEVGEKVVGTYKKVESGVVDGFTKMTDKFVDTFLTREGESVADAKIRMAAERQVREEKMRADAEAREDARKERIDKSLEASRNAGKRNG